jgi:hypothetical protein
MDEDGEATNVTPIWKKLEDAIEKLADRESGARTVPHDFSALDMMQAFVGIEVLAISLASRVVPTGASVDVVLAAAKKISCHIRSGIGLSQPTPTTPTTTKE